MNETEDDLREELAALLRTKKVIEGRIKELMHLLGLMYVGEDNNER